MSPRGGLRPGTKMFSTFLLLALRLGALFFAFLRGAFFFGSGCLTVSASRPAMRRLRRDGAVDFGFAVVVFFFFLPQRHSAKALPAANVGFFAKVLPAFEHCALFMYMSRVDM